MKNNQSKGNICKTHGSKRMEQLANSQAHGPLDLERGHGVPRESLAAMGDKSSKERREKAAKNSKKHGEGPEESASLSNVRQP